MVSIAAPNFPFSEVYDVCIQGTLKYAEYVNIRQNLIDSNNSYINLFQNGEGYKIPKEKNANTNIQYHDLVRLYNDKMLDKKHEARKYYEYIKNAISHCPFCGVNMVKTLEHFMPKKHYPFYAVSPFNLVPSCWECNLGHGSEIDVTDETTLHLHPYFDNTGGIIWLKANIEIIDSAPNFIFEVDDTCGLDMILINRLKSHHSLFNLDLLFSKNAGTEFNGLCHQLIKSFDSGGVDDVVLFLEDMLNSYSHNKWNFWKPPFFKALMNSDWIKNGEFIYYLYK